MKTVLHLSFIRCVLCIQYCGLIVNHEIIWNKPFPFRGLPPSSQINTCRLILTCECLALAWLISSQLFLNYPIYLLPLGFYLSLFLYFSFFHTPLHCCVIGCLDHSIFLPLLFLFFFSSSLSSLFILSAWQSCLSLSCLSIDCSNLY